MTSQTTINLKLSRCSLKSEGPSGLAELKLKSVHKCAMMCTWWCVCVAFQISVIDEGLLRFCKLKELVLSANVISEIPAENLPCNLKVSHQTSSEWCNVFLQFWRIRSVQLFQHVSEDSFTAEHAEQETITFLEVQIRVKRLTGTLIRSCEAG